MRFPAWPRRDAVRLPDAVRAALGGERPLAVAADDAGGWVVGTRDRLHLVAADGSAESWGWEVVHRADWDKETQDLAVEPVQDYGAPVVRRVRHLPEPADLVTLVRERVTATVVVQQRTLVRHKVGFSVIGRRPPTGGEVVWAFELDAGLDPDDPVVRDATTKALAEARASVGL
ncbi:hypothetical protein [Nocardioides marmoribigeumensis]|uniref:Polyketide cyclase / dehydrase and lipid transport n=1 Tax=Nocardioides marmoribigeumensis TaxID=433649 RepID=A0ABU2BRF4_9ACTN|nr:hypothetical protein [Nocardioides marmoribigeumensis]MDR7360851.1 hypothetical protein [Nocardioides marmoribigeumensis]